MDALNRYQNEQRTIEYVMLDRAQAGDIPAPTPEELAKYFEERKVLFRAPEYRKVLLLVLTPAELASTFEISDADLKKAYEERKARYVTARAPPDPANPFPNIEEARAAAERIAKGTTFAALAAERGLKEADIDLGTVTQSAMVDRAVADAAFALKEGEVSAPVEGRFGVVLVQVAKIEPSTTKPFEEVAAELKRTWPLSAPRPNCSTCMTRSRTSGWAARTSPTPPRSSTSRSAPSRRSIVPARILKASRSPTCRRVSTC